LDIAGEEIIEVDDYLSLKSSGLGESIEETHQMKQGAGK